MATKLLIVDDHEIVRRGIAELVDTADIQVVAEASDGDAGVSAARRHKPDVVLLDVRMGGKDGIDAIKRIRSAAPNARVVMLSAFDSSTYVARAVSAGAHDYVLKTATRKELLDAIGGAAKNAPPSRSGEFRRIAGAMAKREVSTATDVPLTPRETQVLRQVALGLSNREIADSLEISIETVKEHVQNLLRKTALDDRTQAAVWAIRHGIA
ncbi:MAG: response regulator [Pirellulales bacterium]|jgi:DNA-binding NarL/FixJ family response regulator